MKATRYECVLLLTLVVAFACTANSTSAERDERPIWNGSRVVGSPDPPLPYTTEAVYPEVAWKQPLYAKAEPGSNALLVVQQGGAPGNTSRIVRLTESGQGPATEPVLQLEGRLIYGLEFDPRYEQNRRLYVFSNGPTGKPERKNQISRFTISDRVAEPNSELRIIEWRSMGHDGGDLVFGHDGMLYITSGDGTTDSDEWLSAQDVKSLLGGVLRIDVRGAEAGRPYRIPSDNPYLNVKGARPELWAIGLRNPWRMTIDQKTGHIWVGNNGQDLWETAHLIRRGENYGWSVYEGNHPFYLNRQRGPGPIVGPTIEHHHREFRSLTGGVVYYGSRFPDLVGSYLYGDYGTGKIWAARHDGKQLVEHRELADTALQIAGFAVSPQDDILVVDYGGQLRRLVRRPEQTITVDFPTTLSETGFFESTANHMVADGVIGYSVCAPGWSDGATAVRYFALPGETQIDYTASGGWNLPDGSVVVQTLSLPAVGAVQLRRIETRLLTKQQGEWAGYSYVWNESQTDAVLVERSGRDLVIETVSENGETMTQNWRVPSRTECLTCHSRAANFLLGISTLQLNREFDGQNQITQFDQWGLFTKALPNELASAAKLADPYNDSADLDARARSYLHVNCSGCHVRAGGGNARMELEFTKSAEQIKLISEHPQHATFGIEQARLVAPGSPERSVLLKRLTTRGMGQMPPLVSNRVDSHAERLFREWIEQLPSARPFVRDWKTKDLMPHVTRAGMEGSVAAGKKVYGALGCSQCHRLSGEGGGTGPDLTDIGKRKTPEQIVDSIVDPSREVAPEFASVLIVTADGEVLQGRLENETETTVEIRTAESFAKPTTIAKDDIEERQLTKQSIMPTSLLNTATAEEIRDLFKFLLDGE